MISVIVFDDLVPILDGDERLQRFEASEGWRIEVRGAEVHLARTPQRGHWAGCLPFVVSGYAFSYRELIPDLEPQDVAVRHGAQGDPATASTSASETPGQQRPSAEERTVPLPFLAKGGKRR